MQGVANQQEYALKAMLLLVLGMSFVSLSVHPGVVLHGALASILAYANDTAQSGVLSSGVGRAWLVAGAGFEPATTRPRNPIRETKNQWTNIGG